jgi:hypothetical protein
MVELALAAELRHYAAVLWRDADKQADPDACRLIASAWHMQALEIEAGIGLDSIDDCTEVYAEPVDDETIFTDLDLNNDCRDPGGHLWLLGKDVRCVHCGAPAMPVYATREAE